MLRGASFRVRPYNSALRAHMPEALDLSKYDDVIALINRTANEVNRARVAFNKAKLTGKHVQNLARAQTNATWLMAYYTDGAGYGLLDDEVMEILWDCGELASKMLEKIMATGTVDLEPVRIAPGRYRLTRKLTDANPVIETSIDCTNPAYGYLKLNEWEDKCRAALAENAARQAQKSKAA